jgi:hypothetical protein
MPNEIAPALAPEEWELRRVGAVSLDAVQNEECVVITGPNGEDLSVSGARDVFALMALANHALSDRDSRKITAAKIEALRDAVREWHRCWLGMAEGSEERLRKMPDFEPRKQMLEETVATLAAILPSHAPASSDLQ